MQGDAVVAGAVLLDWGPTRANPGGQMARIVNVFTADAVRGRGIARELLRAVIEQCEALGARRSDTRGAQPVPLVGLRGLPRRDAAPLSRSRTALW